MRRTGGRRRGAAARRRIRTFARWIGADRNPLRRRIDKFEIAARVALVIGFLVAAPLLAPWAGHVSAVDGMNEVRQQRSWQQVDAVLTHNAPHQFYGYGSLVSYWVPARWTAPSGARRTGDVPARSGMLAGMRIGVWVNQSGRVMGHEPLTRETVRVRTVLTEYMTVAGLGIVLLLLAGLITVILNRRRMTYWAMEWACFGPRWTTRRWPKT